MATLQHTPLGADSPQILFGLRRAYYLHAVQSDSGVAERVQEPTYRVGVAERAQMEGLSEGR